MRVAVVGVPKTIDNDILLMDKTFGFDTAVEEAQRAINSAYIEVQYGVNCFFFLFFDYFDIHYCHPKYLCFVNKHFDNLQSPAKFLDLYCISIIKLLYFFN